ncbi:MAG: metallophosphoesterase [Solobacterium sp.]|nr:metallophosphoesterase [Solobacterium sp.]
MIFLCSFFGSGRKNGSSQSPASFEKALERIKDASPEFILLGGEICDEYTEKEEMQWVFEEFGKINVPVYYFYGSHDRQENSSCYGGTKYSEQESEDAVLSNGIIILKDEWTAFSDDIVLLGREDASHPDERLSAEELPERPEGSYVICVDHSPFQNEDILKTKADLQLSGHTHAGQLFPIRWIYELARLNVVCTYRIGDTDLYVSPGIGNWKYPFRNETHCSYALIDLVKG